MEKLILVVMLILCSFVGNSKSNQEQVDKKLVYGFSLGANYMQLKPFDAMPDNAEINTGFGFKTGILIDYAFAKHFAFSPKVELSFNSTNVDQTYSGNLHKEYQVLPIGLELMPHFVYKIGSGKSIPYVLFGPNLKIPLNKVDDPSDGYSTKVDCALDFGFGLDNKLMFFNIAPEIRYSLGLFNVNGNPTLPPFKSNSISLVLIFK
jgi:hypothetical protein